MSDASEYLIVDSTIIRAHQHAGGVKKEALEIKPLAALALACTKTHLAVAA